MYMLYSVCSLIKNGKVLKTDMKIFKRIFCALLSCITVFSLAACGKQSSVSLESAEASANPSPNPASPTELKIVSDNASYYTIIYSAIAENWEKNAATRFQSVVKALTGVTIPVKADTQTRVGKEIIIGTTTNRSNEYKYAEYDDFKNGYACFVSYERLVLLAGSEAGMYVALREFFDDTFDVDIDNALSKLSNTDFYVSSKYKSSSIVNSTLFPYTEDDLSEYKIVYSASDEYQKRAAYILQENIAKSFGYTLPLTTTSDSKSFTFASNTSVSNGKFKVSVSGTKITIGANDYYGLFGGANHFGVTSSYFPIRNGYSYTGDFRNYIAASSLEESTKYAYNRQGNLRLMYYNVLWDNSTTNPSTERSILQAEIIKQYKPDVLSCQEFDKNKRDSTKDHNGTNDPNYSLVKLLQKHGYEETIDPRVKNADTTENGGYGTTGGTKVTVNGSTYYTFYNCVPLFYNTKTTRYIDGAFYWYKNQIDAENEGNCGISDCASKSANWGLFEKIETGDRYIVINTHMCTRSDGVKGKQAEELIALIKTITEKYPNVPIFLGGDLNGGYSAQNCTKFTAAGYKEFEKGKFATVFNAQVRTDHGYPQYNTTNGMMTQGPNDTLQKTTSTGSVDHIFAVTPSLVSNFGVYGVAVDDVTLSASDHLPMFIDVTI